MKAVQETFLKRKNTAKANLATARPWEKLSVEWIESYLTNNPAVQMDIARKMVATYPTLARSYNSMAYEDIGELNKAMMLFEIAAYNFNDVGNALIRSKVKKIVGGQ